MMKHVLDEYRRSLKMVEAEELFDLILYRPLAFGLVKAIHTLPITPNHVTVASLLFGCAAAIAFGSATAEALIWAAGLYAFANVLDCTDGQLARLQSSGTLLGRLVDGTVDYFVSIAIFLGIGVGWASGVYGGWWLIVAAGLSSSVHAFFFDRHQGEFIAIVRGNHIASSRTGLTTAVNDGETESQHRGHCVRFFLALYSAYHRMLDRPEIVQRATDAVSYRQIQLPMIRWWSVLGPTTNRTLLIACALIGRIDLFVWVIVVAGNAWMISCLLRQGRIDRSLQTGSAQRVVVEKL
jgi:phosphatidylglycerophosphate synthase